MNEMLLWSPGVREPARHALTSNTWLTGLPSFGEPGIYLTFEQLPDQIYRDAENSAGTSRSSRNRTSSDLVCTSPDLLLEPDGAGQLLDSTSGNTTRRMVIDSLNHLEMYLPRGGDMRKKPTGYSTTSRRRASALWLSGRHNRPRTGLQCYRSRDELPSRLHPSPEVCRDRVSHEEGPGDNEDERQRP